MQEIFYILAKIVSLSLDIVSIGMLIRMITSFLGDPDSRLYLISCYITEPFIAPVRALMAYFNIGQDSPIDLAFFITSILIGIIGSLLPSI